MTRKILDAIAAYYRTGPDKAALSDPKEIRRTYERKRWSVFLSLIFGYSFFYVCRLSFSVAKKPMLNAGILGTAQMGKIGSAFFLTYAIGKLTNGFVADRSNIRRFMSTGLLVSAVLVLLFGFTNAFLVFVMLWGVNGWFQSMGSAPSGASISQWFSNRERGTRYGLWSMAHSIGEGMTFAVTAMVVAWLGWRWGFWSAGAISLLVALMMFNTLADRPQTYGLTPVADYKNDRTGEPQSQPATVGEAQWGVVKNPYVWILGLACAAMYVVRYGINSWGVLYLQEAKSYPLVVAGGVLSWAKIVETGGAVSAGFVSDFFFKARRNVTTLVYGLTMIGGLVLLFASPPTYLFSLERSYARLLGEERISGGLEAAFEKEGVALPASVRISSNGDAAGDGWLIHSSRWYLRWQGYRVEDTGAQLNVMKKYGLLHVLGISLFGFGLGGLLVFLGGLIAIDICSKKASGAAMGFVGMFSYVGAAFQDWVSGSLLEANRTVLHGMESHDFQSTFYFWLGAAIVSVALSTLLWNVKPTE